MQLTGITLSGGITIITPPPPPNPAMVLTVNVDGTTPYGGGMGVRVNPRGLGTNVNINWGDGTSTNFTTNNATIFAPSVNKTYAATGIYDITITGTMQGYGSGLTLYNFLVGVKSWGTTGLLDIENMFYGTDNTLTFINGKPPLTITSMKGAFQQSTANIDISGWDVRNVTNMTDMFSGASAFNQNLSGWCVPLIPTKPSGFDNGTTAWNKTGRVPVWGTCPGG